MRGVEGTVRDGAYKVLWQLLPGLYACLLGIAGVGFLTASAYLALSTMISARWASFFIGVGLLVLAGATLMLAKYYVSKRGPADAPETPPAASAVAAVDAGSIIAFTAAFVLARYFADPEDD